MRTATLASLQLTSSRARLVISCAWKHLVLKRNSGGSRILVLAIPRSICRSARPSQELGGASDADEDGGAEPCPANRQVSLEHGTVRLKKVYEGDAGLAVSEGKASC